MTSPFRSRVWFLGILLSGFLFIIKWYWYRFRRSREFDWKWAVKTTRFYWTWFTIGYWSNYWYSTIWNRLFQDLKNHLALGRVKLPVQNARSRKWSDIGHVTLTAHESFTDRPHWGIRHFHWPFTLYLVEFLQNRKSEKKQLYRSKHIFTRKGCYWNSNGKTSYYVSFSCVAFLVRISNGTPGTRLNLH